MVHKLIKRDKPSKYHDLVKSKNKPYKPAAKYNIDKTIVIGNKKYISVLNKNENKEKYYWKLLK